MENQNRSRYRRAFVSNRFGQNFPRLISPSARITGSTSNKALFQDNWTNIKNYVRSCADVRSGLCGGCGKGCLYDINGKQYSISRFTKMEDIKKTIEEIREINKNAKLPG